MTNIPGCFLSLLAAWNEKTPARVRGHLDAALAPEIAFTDPNYMIVGIDAFEAMVHEFHAQYPVSTCVHTSGLDQHHNICRYEWLVSVNGVPAVPGMDVAELDAQGRVVRIDGFFGPFPKLP